MQIAVFSRPGITEKCSLYQGATSCKTEVAQGFITRTGDNSATIVGNRVTPNPWSYWYQEDHHLEGEYWFTEKYPWNRTIWKGWIHNQYDYVPRLAHFPNASATDPYNKALEKLYDSIRSDVDLSIDIYQVGQTVKMIKSVASALASPVRTLAKSMQAMIRDRKINRSSSMISNKWLEWQYGVKPSMATIYSLTHDLVKQVSHPSGFLSAKSRASSTLVSKQKRTCGSYPNLIPVTIDVSDSRRAEIAIIYGISNAERNALSQFTSLNPISFVYENIPFSFVLDWVVDIGGYLRMMETALMTGLEFKSGYVTQSRKTVLSAFALGLASNPSTEYRVNGKSSSKHVSVNRQLLASMPLPRRPSLDISLGSSRLFSAAALLRGLIKH